MPDPVAPDPALDVLRRRWGYEAFRPGQAEAVGAVLAGRDVFAVLPTGGGKSLVYQVPALVREGVALVVSPLLALIHDQVEALRARGVRASALHSGLSRRGADDVWNAAEHGGLDLLYLTPERLQTEPFRLRAGRLPTALLAVDEAHCISEWGHDFRPAYRQIADAHEALRGADGARPPLVAVTATATPDVRRDILAQLRLLDPHEVAQGFDRPNLVWSVHHVDDKAAQALRIARGVPGAGLLYAGTRRQTERWATTLRRAGVSAEAYHAGMDADAREAVRKRWLDGETRVVTATSAFGMGIDKPDVRWVAHTALPPTLEAYYQEAGRAGRDGARSYCALLVGRDDDQLPRAFAETSFPDAGTVAAVYETASSLMGVAVGSHPASPTRLDVEAVARVAEVRPAVVRAAVAHLERAGAWELEGTRDAFAIRFAPPVLRRVAESDPSPGVRAVADRLLRVLPAEAAQESATQSARWLSDAVGLPRERLARALAHLADYGALDAVDLAEAPGIRWREPRRAVAPVDAAALRRARLRAERHLGYVVGYTRAVGCRRRHLLAYFDQRAPARCGRCDLCLGRHRPTAVTPEDEGDLRAVLRGIAPGLPRAEWELGAMAPRRRDALLDWLLFDGLVRLDDPLADTFSVTPKGRKALGRAEPAERTSETGTGA